MLEGSHESFWQHTSECQHLLIVKPQIVTRCVYNSLQLVPYVTIVIRCLVTQLLHCKCRVKAEWEAQMLVFQLVPHNLFTAIPRADQIGIRFVFCKLGLHIHLLSMCF